MDSNEPVGDDRAWWLAAAYIDAWNKRDRDAWLDQLHPELELRPTALVGTRIVYHGIEGAARYFAELIASGRAEQAEIVGLRRIGPDRFLIELELLHEGTPVMRACIISQVRDRKFVDTRGYLSDARMLAAAGLISEDAPAVPQPDPGSSLTAAGKRAVSAESRRIR